jgi:TolA protein
MDASGSAASMPPRLPPKLQGDYDYDRGLKWSLALHVAAIAGILIKSLVFPSNPTPYIPTLRVDIVGLPDILKKDLKNTPSGKDVSEILKKAEEDAKKIKPAKLPKIKAVTEPDEIALKPLKQDDKKIEKKRERDMKAALDRMKALAKLVPDSERHSTPLIKGNKISKGSSLSGDARESDQSNYYDSVLQRLQNNWALPIWLSRQNLSAQVQIFIDARGRLHGFRFVKTSGNPQFDDAVKRALAESEPFPLPPEELSSNVLVNGIIFGFPL